jgi:hypothetical protein
VTARPVPAALAARVEAGISSYRRIVTHDHLAVTDALAALAELVALLATAEKERDEAIGAQARVEQTASMLKQTEARALWETRDRAEAAEARLRTAEEALRELGELVDELRRLHAAVEPVAATAPEKDWSALIASEIDRLQRAASTEEEQ